MRHNLSEQDSAESAQSQRLCYSHFQTSEYFHCLPSRFLDQKQGRISADVGFQANERGIGILGKLYNRNLQQKDLDLIFASENFQTISGGVRMEAVYGRTSFSYTPLHGIGAFKISNPSLPEVNLAATRQTVARLTHVYVSESIVDSEIGSFLVAPSLYYYKRYFYFVDSDLLSIAGRPLPTLLESYHRNALDLDLSIGFLSKIWWFPTVGLNSFNLLNRGDCSKCSLRKIDLEDQFLPNFHLSISYWVPSYLGNSQLGVAVPFDQYARAGKSDSVLSYVYWISRLGVFASFSPMKYAFGFLFGTDNYQMGIQYTDEKQDDALQIDRRKQTFVFTTLAI